MFSVLDTIYIDGSTSLVAVMCALLFVYFLLHSGFDGFDILFRVLEHTKSNFGSEHV